LPVPEARAFIRDLTEMATQPALVYRHIWQKFDLAMWAIVARCTGRAVTVPRRCGICGGRRWRGMRLPYSTCDERLHGFDNPAVS
jgi:hypothetical protein